MAGMAGCRAIGSGCASHPYDPSSRTYKTPARPAILANLKPAQCDLVHLVGSDIQFTPVHRAPRQRTNRICTPGAQLVYTPIQLIGLLPYSELKKPFGNCRCYNGTIREFGGSYVVQLVSFNETLSQKQRQAILFLAEGSTPAETGKKLNVAAKTISNWKCSRDFRAELDAVQRQLFAEGVSQLRALVGQATATLRSVMADVSATHRDRIAAARTVYQFADVAQASSISEAPTDFNEDDPVFEAAWNEINTILKKHGSN